MDFAVGGRLCGALCSARCGRRLLQRQADHDDDRLESGRRQRGLRAPARPSHGEAYSGQSDGHCSRACRARAAPCWPTGSPRSRRATEPPSARCSALCCSIRCCSTRPFNFNPIEFNWLGSLNRETNVLIVVGRQPGQVDRGRQEIRGGARGRRRRNRGRDLSDAGQRFSRHQVSGRVRLSGRRRHDARHRAREVEGRGGVPWSAIKATSAQKLADGKIKVILQMALKPNPELAGVPVAARLGEERRAQTGAGAAVRPLGNGPSLRAAARRAGGARGDAAQGLHRHDQGSRNSSPRHRNSTSKSMSWTAKRCRS